MSKNEQFFNELLENLIGRFIAFSKAKFRFFIKESSIYIICACYYMLVFYTKTNVFFYCFNRVFLFYNSHTFYQWSNSWQDYLS